MLTPHLEVLLASLCLHAHCPTIDLVRSAVYQTIANTFTVALLYLCQQVFQDQITEHFIYHLTHQAYERHINSLALPNPTQYINSRWCTSLEPLKPTPNSSEGVLLQSNTSCKMATIGTSKGDYPCKLPPYHPNGTPNVSF